MRATVAANLDRGITQKEVTNRAVGEAIGKTEHQVWRWRKGYNMPETETLIALANVLFDGDLNELYADHDGTGVAA